MIREFRVRQKQSLRRVGENPFPLWLTQSSVPYLFEKSGPGFLFETLTNEPIKMLDQLDFTVFHFSGEISRFLLVKVINA